MGHYDGKLTIQCFCLRSGRLLSRLPSKPSEGEFRRLLAGGIEEEIEKYDYSMRGFIAHASIEQTNGHSTAPLTSTAQIVVQVCKLMLLEPLVPFDTVAAQKADQASEEALGILKLVSQL